MRHIGSLIAVVAILGLALPASAEPISLFEATTSGSNQLDPILENFAIGLDFSVVGAPLQIVSLGFYDETDSTGEGLLFDHPISIYDLDGNLIVRATVPKGTATTLIDGFRYVDIDPIVLQVGFEGSIVAGMLDGNTDPNANTHGQTADSTIPHDPAPTLNDGGGALILIGSGRYGFDPYSLPTIIDGGPAARYHAGSFRYNVLENVPEPASMLLLGLAAVAAGITLRRRRRPL
jgi:hypothetical protein